MFITIPTWLVVTTTPSGEEQETWRVPETNLDVFLHVLTFNRREFTVSREREEVELDV